MDKKDPNKDASNMGGPSFHPQMDSIKKTGAMSTTEKTGKKAGQIVEDDDLPAVTPPDQNYGF